MKGKAMFFVRKLKPNTFIGGVGTTITSAAALAAKIGISSTRIKGFKVVGSDIECNITGSYSIQGAAFQNNSEITYYNDAGGLVVTIYNSSFRNCSNLLWVVFEKQQV